MNEPARTDEQPRTAASGGASPVSGSWTFGLPVFGTVVGCVGALCGIGGGLFTTPLLNLGVGLVLPSAIATSLVLVFTTAASATFSEALSPDSNIVWPIAAAVALGAFIGARVGFKFVQRLGADKLSLAFGFFLVYAGLRMLFASSPPEVAGALEITPMALGISFLTGLVGGTVSPMMGIGGGVVMVPGLALFVPGLGFPGARAAALAAAMVGAGSGVWLYARRQRVQWRFGLLLAVGALVGATIGVQLTRYDGAAVVGKRLLGVLVLFVAVRYLVGAWRDRAAKKARLA